MIDYINNLNKSLLLQNNKLKDFLSSSLTSNINKQLLNIQKDFRNSINNNFYKNILGVSFNDDLIKIQKSLLGETMLSKITQITGFDVLTKSYKESVNKIADSFKTKNLISQLSPVNDILKYSNKYVNNLTKSMAIQNSLFDNNLIKMSFSMYAEVSQFNKIYNYNKSPVIEKIRNEINSINYQELDFYKNELKSIHNIDFEEIRVEIQEDLNNFKDDLISYIDKKFETKKESKIKSVFKYIFLELLLPVIFFGYIVNMTSPELKEIIIKNISEKDKLINKQIQNEIIEYRYVVTDCLNVRLYDSSKSKIVGKLYKNEIVIVNKILGDWILIERIENDVILKGWVYRRYVKKIK